MLWFRTPEKVYFKKGCMPVALDELGTSNAQKKAFIVTDYIPLQERICRSDREETG